MAANSLADLVLENAVGYAIFSVDSKGIIESWSKGAELTFGLSTEDAISRDFAEFFTPSDLAAGAPARELEVARREGRAEDSRWHRRSDGQMFWGNGMTMVIDGASPARFLKIVRDETPAKLAEEQRVLLLNELNHRIKNTLVTVQSIIEQTLRAHAVSDAARSSLTDRILALAKAHDILVAESWAGADLGSIVASAASPYVQPGLSRIQAEGPPVRLSPQQAVTMALLLHELIINAVKHGALSNDAGTIRLSWNLAQDGSGARYMTLLWRERGGPPVLPSPRRGFGSRLLSRGFTNQEGGRVSMSFPPEGAQCIIELRLSQPEELPLNAASALNGSAAPPPAVQARG